MWDIEVAQSQAVALIGHLPTERDAMWGQVIRTGWLPVSAVEAMTPGEQVALLRDISEAVDYLTNALRLDLVEQLRLVLVEEMGADEVVRRTECENCHDELPSGGGIHDPGQLGVMPRPPFFCDQSCLDEAAERRGSAAFQ